jgi:hypothetical protein
LGSIISTLIDGHPVEVQSRLIYVGITIMHMTMRKYRQILEQMHYVACMRISQYNYFNCYY